MIHCQRDIPKDKWRYGLRSSAAAGCGWIAVYNALELLGMKSESEELIRYFLRRVPLINGLFGTMPLSPAAYLKKRGLMTRWTLRRKRIDDLVKESDAAVVYYWWRWKRYLGAHFIAVQFDGENFIGWNVYANSKGPSVLGPSLDAYFRTGKDFFPIVIGVKKP